MIPILWLQVMVDHCSKSLFYECVLFSFGTPQEVAGEQERTKCK